MKMSMAKAASYLTFTALFGIASSGPITGSKAYATEAKETSKYVLNPNNQALVDPDESVLKAKKFDPKSLHRLDFHVANKTCGVCLLNIQKKTRAIPAVVNAAVEIKRPFCASVIYDTKQTNEKELLEEVRSFEKDLLLDMIQDKAIAKQPLVLIPPHLGNGENNATPAANH
jgi:copper chaperone CopZ